MKNREIVRRRELCPIPDDHGPVMRCELCLGFIRLKARRLTLMREDRLRRLEGQPPCTDCGFLKGHAPDCDNAERWEAFVTEPGERDAAVLGVRDLEAMRARRGAVAEVIEGAPRPRLASSEEIAMAVARFMARTGNP
jgi:hypothetical protein